MYVYLYIEFKFVPALMEIEWWFLLFIKLLICHLSKHISDGEDSTIMKYPIPRRKGHTIVILLTLMSLCMLLSKILFILFLLFYSSRSLGCILYEMCCMNHAFTGHNFLSVVLKIVEGDTPSLPDRYPSQLNAVLCRYVILLFSRFLS